MFPFLYQPMSNGQGTNLASVAGLEPATSAFVERRSLFHLSYTELTFKNRIRMAGLEPT